MHSSFSAHPLTSYPSPALQHWKGHSPDAVALEGWDPLSLASAPDSDAAADSDEVDWPTQPATTITAATRINRMAAFFILCFWLRYIFKGKMGFGFWLVHNRIIQS